MKKLIFYNVSLQNIFGCALLLYKHRVNIRDITVEYKIPSSFELEDTDTWCITQAFGDHPDLNNFYGENAYIEVAKKIGLENIMATTYQWWRMTKYDYNEFLSEHGISLDKKLFFLEEHTQILPELFATGILCGDTLKEALLYIGKSLVETSSKVMEISAAYIETSKNYMIDRLITFEWNSPIQSLHAILLICDILREPYPDIVINTGFEGGVNLWFLNTDPNLLNFEQLGKDFDIHKTNSIFIQERDPKKIEYFIRNLIKLRSPHRDSSL